MSKHKIQNLKEFIAERFKKSKNYQNLVDYFEKLRSTHIVELEYIVIGIINPLYGPGFCSFYQMLHLQQGKLNLKQFQKRILLALYGIGNTISEEYKVAMVESKFNQDLLSEIEQNGQFSEMKSEVVLDLILNHIKKRYQKNKSPKCFKCKRVGHISKDCNYHETIDGNELISYKKKEKNQNHQKDVIKEEEKILVMMNKLNFILF